MNSSTGHTVAHTSGADRRRSTRVEVPPVEDRQGVTDTATRKLCRLWSRVNIVHRIEFILFAAVALKALYHLIRGN
jgi:hypothetical protein